MSEYEVVVAKAQAAFNDYEKTLKIYLEKNPTPEAYREEIAFLKDMREQVKAKHL
jgi:hypothetical protein